MITKESYLYFDYSNSIDDLISDLEDYKKEGYTNFENTTSGIKVYIRKDNKIYNKSYSKPELKNILDQHFLSENNKNIISAFINDLL